MIEESQAVLHRDEHEISLVSVDYCESLPKQAGWVKNRGFYVPIRNTNAYKERQKTKTAPTTFGNLAGTGCALFYCSDTRA